MALTNQQYQSISRAYEERRLTHFREMKEKEAAAYARFPRLEEIDSEMSSLYAQKARILIGTATGQDSDIDEKIDDLILEKKALLSGAGFKNGIVEPVYDCPLCKDTGYINGSKCSCFKKAQAELLCRTSNLGEILNEENFSTFSVSKYSDSIVDPDTGKSARKNASEAYEYCRKFTDTFFSEYDNICFSGKTGVGKTFLAHCIAKEILDAGGSVIFLSAPNLISMFEDDRFRTTDDTRRSIQTLFTCDLLVVDDLAASVNNSFVSASLLRLLDERHINKKSTVITTNLSLDELRATYSDRIMSRIYGYYKWLFLFGRDIRTE